MIRPLLLSFLAALMLCGTAMAQPRAAAEEQPNALRLETTDGKFYTFLFDQFVNLSCADGTLSVAYNDESQGLSWLYFTLAEVKEFRFVNDATGIDEVPATPGSERQVLFSVKQHGIVTVSGLLAGDLLQAVSLDGKTVVTTKAALDGTQTIDLTQQPRGIYVVSVNRSFTFKLMKP